MRASRIEGIAAKIHKPRPWGQSRARVGEWWGRAASAIQARALSRRVGVCRRMPIPNGRCCLTVTPDQEAEAGQRPRRHLCKTVLPCKTHMSTRNAFTKRAAARGVRKPVRLLHPAVRSAAHTAAHDRDPASTGRGHLQVSVLGRVVLQRPDSLVLVNIRRCHHNSVHHAVQPRLRTTRVPVPPPTASKDFAGAARLDAGCAQK